MSKENTQAKKPPVASVGTSPPNLKESPGFGGSRSDFVFDAQNHRYLVAGVEWPSITGLLKEFGIVDDKWFSPFSADKGTAVHAACHYWDDGDLDALSLTQGIRPYLEGWRKFIKDTGFSPFQEFSEKPMVSKIHKFGCTPDRIGRLGGKLSVVEIKSGQINILAVKLQTAAQFLAYSEFYGLTAGGGVCRRMAVQLSPGDYRIVDIPISELLSDCANVAAMAQVHWLKRLKRD